MKQFLENLLQMLLGEDTEISVAENEDEYGKHYQIFVPDDKIGIVIGKSGKTIQAIRTLASVKTKGKKVFVNIAETSKK